MGGSFVIQGHFIVTKIQSSKNLSLVTYQNWLLTLRSNNYELPLSIKCLLNKLNLKTNRKLLINY